MSLEILSPIYLYFDVWIQLGPKGQIFTYENTNRNIINAGDLVKVYLKQRPHLGIVIRGRNTIPSQFKNFNLKSIESNFKLMTVDPDWYIWLEAAASIYHTSFFKMLKTALPSHWLGTYNSHSQSSWQEVRITLITKLPLKRNQTLTNKQLELIHWLRQQPNQDSVGNILQEKKFSMSTINSLKRKSIVYLDVDLNRKLSPKNNYLKQEINALLIKLNSDQELALQKFKTLNKGQGILLWGVTGSGKTEVYISTAATQLQKGYNVLLLTPEISLIPQLVERCRKYFGQRVKEYHSYCTEDDRAHVWKACYSSASQPILVIGTRSAIFLPLNPLSLIILDEEHDNSYKQESLMPCYHARDLALMRSKICRTKIILGSATPSLEAWRVGYNQPTFCIVRLRQRISHQRPPRICIVDMRLELREGHKHLISRSLLYQLKNIKALGEQAIILVPRRGYSSFLSCCSCGTVVECPQCDSALKVHQSTKQYSWLHCHWCNYKDTIQQKCHDCGAQVFRAFGIGTQQVMGELERSLKNLKIMRFDRDSTQEQGGHRQILAQFASGKADILVGTQMLSKGIDLPRVTLAAVLAADGLLHRPDLRSSEQSLQLLLQLAGRAGRGDKPGTVFIQTYYPKHPIMRYLVNGQYEDFLVKELTIRKASGLAPYSRSYVIHFSGISDAVTQATANMIAENLRLGCTQSGWKLIGPFPAPVRRISNRSRWQLLLHGQEGCQAPLNIDTDFNELIPKSVRCKVDPDPIGF